MPNPHDKRCARRAPRLGPHHAALAGALLLVAGCGAESPPADTVPAVPAAAEALAEGASADPCPAEPCPIVPSTRPPKADDKNPPRFAAGSPFDTEYKPPIVKDGKRMWARSCLFREAPALVVEQWLSAKPETAGKVVLVEFWATWCPPCRRSIALLNRLHARFGEELVVIGISDETPQAVRALEEPHIQYYSAVDTQGRMKEALGVFGIPHVIIIEPGGYVVWEGFPLQKGYELTEEKVAKILAAGKQP